MQNIARVVEYVCLDFCFLRRLKCPKIDFYFPDDRLIIREGKVFKLPLFYGRRFNVFLFSAFAFASKTFL